MSANTAKQIRKNYRYNFVVNALDGSFFWCGSSFIATTTILPLYISHLTDSKLALGILSMISAMGWLTPQIFTANVVQRLPRKKVLPVNIGFFTERLPIILMVPAALFLSTRWSMAALVVFLFLFAWHAFGAGVVAVAWQDMIAKIIPIERRGLFFGMTNFVGTATGVLGASAAAWMLDRYPFPNGYVLAFASAGTLILISWIFLSMVREPAERAETEKVSQLEYLRRLPAILRNDTNFRRYILSRIVLALSSMAGGFTTVYAVQRWDLSDGQAGGFTTAMLIGQALSNLVFGPMADRKGHKLVLEIGYLLGAIAIGLAAIAPEPWLFYPIFAISGATMAAFMISGLMIAVEFCPPNVRATYIGLNNTLTGIAGGLAPLIGGWLAEALGYRGVFVIAFLLGIIGVGLLHWWVREPRTIPSKAS